MLERREMEVRRLRADREFLVGIEVFGGLERPEMPHARAASHNTWKIASVIVKSKLGAHVAGGGHSALSHRAAVCWVLLLSREPTAEPGPVRAAFSVCLGAHRPLGGVAFHA